ncbi:MAG: hypothetical protein IJ460_08900 [Clostridia bacterium]|nr:hypothetical protein [Clostridia bacterium]
MKRIALILILTLSLTSVYAGSSMPGDIAGEHYITDISAILNGAVISSRNIGGYTVISAEAMRFYGFDVVWSEAERTLNITFSPDSDNGEPPTIKSSNIFSGNFGGYYYYTDIVTYLDGMPVTAYNIGGETYILAEEMSRFGYNVQWIDSDRWLVIDKPGYSDFLAEYYAGE